MPIFTIPIHELREDNDCHTPAGSPAGGQFCAKPLTAAQVVRSGQSFDLVAAAQVGTSGSRRLTRRFLFNPASREFVLGGAMGVEGRDQSHAEALTAAEPEHVQEYGAVAAARRYDKFAVHGHVQSEPGPMAIVIDRIVASELTPGGFNREARDAEASDRLAALARRLRSMGATADTQILARELSGSWTTLGQAFPDVFPKAKARRLKKAA